MKTPITIALILSGIFAQAQSLGIKFASPKTFIVVPAQTIATDSIYINQFVDNGTSLEALVTFYTSTMESTTKTIVIWQGSDYLQNKDYTKAQLKARIKTLLTQ